MGEEGQWSRKTFLSDRLALVVLLAEALWLLSRVRRGLSNPFWYDEQWRAYYASLGRGFWSASRTAEAPMAAGWIALERLSIAVFGNVEWALRLPMALSLAALLGVTYLLARRWLGVLPSLLAAAALGLNPSLTEFAGQLKPFTFEAFVAVAALLLWFRANYPRREGWPRLRTYVLLGLCTVFATSAVFVVGAVLLTDIVRVRRRSWRQDVWGFVAAASITGLHLFLFILHQSQLVGKTAWRDNFVPRSSLTSALHFLITQAAGFIPEGVAPAVTEPSLSSLGVLVRIFLVGALIAGAVVASLNERIRPLLYVLTAIFGLQVLTAGLRLWPFGLVRVNLFLLPFLYIVAAIGITGIVRQLAAVTSRPAFHPAVRGLAATTLLLLLLGIGKASRDVVAVDEALLGALHRQSSGVAYGDGIRDFVARARAQAAPGDVGVVMAAEDPAVGNHQPMARKGWTYYMEQYDNIAFDASAHQPVSETNTLFLVNAPNPAIARDFVFAHPRAQHVFLLVYTNEPAVRLPELRDSISLAGFHETSADPRPFTGTLVTLSKN